MNEYEARTVAIAIAKAQIWEEAKGKLRALASVSGQCIGAMMPEHRETYRELDKAVEEFIERIEGAALHE